MKKTIIACLIAAIIIPLVYLLGFYAGLNSPLSPDVDFITIIGEVM